jgi:hypothetical protein
MVLVVYCASSTSGMDNKKEGHNDPLNDINLPEHVDFQLQAFEA